MTDSDQSDGISRRQSLLGAITVGLGGLGVVSPSATSQSDVTGESAVQIGQGVIVTDVQFPNQTERTDNFSQIGDDDTTFQFGSDLTQGDSVQLQLTLSRRSSEPVALRATVDTPPGVQLNIEVDNSEFDSSTQANLLITLSAEITLSPGFYTIEIEMTPQSFDSPGSDGSTPSSKADVHFLLDNSISARNDLATISDGVTGFFDAVEKQSGNRIDLAASVSAFGGEKSETGDGTPETRVVQQVTTISDDVEAAAEEVEKDPDSSFNEDGYVALRNVLDGDAGRRSGADQIPILFSDELGPNVIDEQAEIEKLQNRVKQEAPGFIGIGDSDVRLGDEPPIPLKQFTNNITDDIDGEFFESPNLTTDLLAGEIAETVRVAVDDSINGAFADEETFLFAL